jgi:hypothetical protein
MPRRRLWMVTCVFLLLFIGPRFAQAGIGEFIWEMSGPSMVGGGLDCRFRLTGELDQCVVFGPVKLRDAGDAPRVYLSLDGGAYVSLGKNADDIDYRAGQLFMLAVDPMIGFTSRLGEHAVGLSYNFLFGKHFSSFSNVGLKLRPIVVRWGRVKWEYNLRLYPNGFDGFNTPEGAGLVRGDDFELVHSISIGF